MKILPKPSVITHVPIVHGGKTQRIDSETIDFSSNVSPLGPPISVKKTMLKNIDNIREYPDIGSSGIMPNLARYTGLGQSNLMVGNGAVEIIYNFCFAFLAKDTRVLIPVPVFAEYEAAAKLYGSQVSYFETMNLSQDLDGFISQIPQNGCVFICNPNNPTGRLLPKTMLVKIIKNAQKLSTLVFVDECFIEMVPESDESILSYIKKYDNLFVLRSFTKSFALAGIRIGYAAAHKQIIEILQKIRIPWSVNSLALAAANAALKDRSYITKSNLVIKRELCYLTENINKLDGLYCTKSATNFILIRTNMDSSLLQKKLLRHKILVRDCKNFRGLENHHIRVAVRSHRDNLKLVRALGRTL